MGIVCFFIFVWSDDYEESIYCDFFVFVWFCFVCYFCGSFVVVWVWSGVICFYWSGCGGGLCLFEWFGNMVWVELLDIWEYCEFGNLNRWSYYWCGCYIVMDGRGDVWWDENCCVCWWGRFEEYYDRG